MDLLFTLCTWHAFAKLRLHTETTLDHFEATTTSLGQLLRRFLNVTCNAFDTRETPSEEAARGRRKAAMAAKGLASAKSKAKAAEGTIEAEAAVAAKIHTPTKSKVKAKAKAAGDTIQAEATKPPRKRAKFSLCTYKLHALGDYCNTIRLLGTTDNYNTQTVRSSVLESICTNTILGRAGTSKGKTILCPDKQKSNFAANCKARTSGTHSTGNLLAKRGCQFVIPTEFHPQRPFNITPTSSRTFPRLRNFGGTSTNTAKPTPPHIR